MRNNKAQRQMKKGLKAFMYENELLWYFDKINIENQNLVSEIFSYFNEGEGKKKFKPLAFLNLLWKQCDTLVSKINEPDKVIEDFKKIPLNHYERHILFGFILKCFGGYPVQNFNEQYDLILKKIQTEFLAFKGETPEKEFCKADKDTRKKLMKLEIALNTAINTGTDAETLYNAIEGKEKTKANSFGSFNELFEAGFEDKRFENEGVKLATRCRYNFNYNVWLQETKDFEYGNEEQYKNFLNIETFQEFLDFEGNKTDAEKYFELVENEAKIYIDIFNKKYEASGNKDRLLQTELENYEKLFFAEKLPLQGWKNNTDTPINGLKKFTSIDISDIRDLYQKIIVEGQRDYYANFHNLRLEALMKYYEFLKDMNKKPDPFSISHNSDNSIKFRGEKIYFPFACYKLFTKLGMLHEKLNDKNVCATDLQSYPQEIFDEPEFKNHPELSKWIYNIIYTWICDSEKREPANKRLFDEFLNLCKEKALLEETSQNQLNGKPKPEIKPIFKAKSIDTIFEILENHFPKQESELKQVLQTGNVSKEKLLFNGSGKTLLDFFKELMKGQFLTIAVQKDFETWISKGFMFRYRNEWKPFNEKYASKIISGNERAAKGNRLINVINPNGKFEIIQLAITNRK